jgi:hypothetical protein
MPKTARHQSEFTTYVVPITDWRWTLSFGINPGRWPPGTYNDYRHLTLSGTLLRPRRLETRAVSLTLMPTVLSETSDTPPQGGGSLNLNLALDRVLQGLLTLPIDALAPVLVMLTAERLNTLSWTARHCAIGMH